MYIAPGDDTSDILFCFTSFGTGTGSAYFHMRSSGESNLHKYGYIGVNTRAWSHMYAYSMYDDNGTLGNFDEHDDLAIIDAIEIAYEGEFETDPEGRPLRDTDGGFKYEKDALGENKYTLDKDGKKIPYRTHDGTPLINPATLPEFLNNDGFSNAGNLATFSWGAIKQLHQKVKDQQEIIIQFGEAIAALEATLSA